MAKMTIKSIASPLLGTALPVVACLLTGCSVKSPFGASIFGGEPSTPTTPCLTGGNVTTPYFLMPCSGTPALTTEHMTASDYDAIVAAVRKQYDSLSSECTATTCPQADWAGCVLRVAGHDFMDFNTALGRGGSDGCLDLSDADNVGLSKCLHEGEFAQSLAQSYSGFCRKISLADFIVVAAEAVMTLSREHVTRDDGRRVAIDFKQQFKFGRTTSVTCDFSKGLMPDAEGSCSAVEETFVNRLGLNWRQAAALMGVHTLGRAHPDNSGYDGFWSDAENSRRFNNDYYVSILLKGWGPETAINGNSGKNQWERVDVGVDTRRLGKEMMLNTDLCLAYTMDDAGRVELDSASAARSDCDCAWVDARQVQTARTTYNGNEFCGSTANPGNLGEQRQSCCGTRRGQVDCGNPRSLQGPAAADIRDFANNEARWIDSFLAAWDIATSKGFRLQPLVGGQEGGIFV